MSDIERLEARLRVPCRYSNTTDDQDGPQPDPLHIEAADALTTMRALLRRAGEVLTPFANVFAERYVRDYRGINEKSCAAARTLTADIASALGGGE